MNRSHVTLPQILVAASARHANMVPESAGYLVLALCEAIGCLPLIVPDSAIELSAEGTVEVTQQGKVVAGPEAAQAMRDLFSRLLAVTTGPTPRLAAVARSRELSAERSVEVVAAEVEAALVPMNRAAGKRSLGRLARETLRAIESGNLALHLQARTAAKEVPTAAKEAIAPLLVAPNPVVKPTFTRPAPPPAPLTPPPSLLGDASDPFAIPVTPTTPGLGLETVATEAHVDSSIFGATPTYQEGDSLAVAPASVPHDPPLESPGFDSTNTAISCEPTQLSAREVHVDPALRAPKSEESTKAVSTGRRVRRAEPPRSPQEITLTSAGVEPISVGNFDAPAPSGPEVISLVGQPRTSSQEFPDCHDGYTQSAPNYHETLVGLAPVLPDSTPSDNPNSTEALKSSEYIVVTPSTLPEAGLPAANDAVTNPLAELVNDEKETNAVVRASDDEMQVHADQLFAGGHDESKSSTVDAIAEAEAEADAKTATPLPGFQALDNPSDAPGRVDELLGTFGRPEEGEEEMLRRTASSLKELAGLDPTPCAPSVSPVIRVPYMSNRASPAWLPADPRQATPLEPAPLVESPRGWRSKLKV
ncbi:MAG TPA: hypothetical protein PK156_50180, partial [Polyangium sp.]|nr:hypothetical protein [Polyangium sp.]